VAFAEGGEEGGFQVVEAGFHLKEGLLNPGGGGYYLEGARTEKKRAIDESLRKEGRFLEWGVIEVFLGKT